MIGDKVIIKVGNLHNVFSIEDGLNKYQLISNKVIRVTIVTIGINGSIGIKYHNNHYWLTGREYTVIRDNKINKLLYKLNL